MEESESPESEADLKDAQKVAANLRSNARRRSKKIPAVVFMAAGAGVAILFAVMLLIGSGGGSTKTTAKAVPGNPPAAESTDPLLQGNPIPPNFEPDFFAGQNDVRTKAKEAPLTLDAAVTEVARLRAQDMATNHYLSHTSPTGETAVTMLGAANYGVGASAENLARIDKGESWSSTLKAFLNSPTHKASIMDEKYTSVGISSVIGDDGKRYLVVIFVGKDT